MIELLLISIPFAIVAGLLLLKKWQWALLAVMPLVLFEGALRKWILPGFQAQIYFIKDALVLLVIVGFFATAFRRGAHERYMGRITILLLVSLVYFIVQVGNPNSPTPAVGLLGLKAYMLYTPLVLIVPYLFHSRDDMDRKLKLLMLMMIPIALLGLVQFALPGSHWLNTYVQQDVDTNFIVSEFGIGRRVRAAGTFSYIGGFGTFVVAAFNMSLAYVLVAKNGVRANWIPYALLAASTMAVFTTGSRWVLLGTFGTTPLVLFLLMRNGQISSAFFARLAGAALFLTLVVLTLAGDAFDAMLWRANNADSAVMRAMSPLVELYNAFETSPFFGTGIGTNSNGSWILAGTRTLFEAYWLYGHYYEVETARVMQEVGLIGFVLVYTLRIVLLTWAIWMVAALRTPLYKAMSAAIAAFFFLHLGLFVIHNPTAGLFYWFAAGLLFAMYRFDYEAHRQAAAPTRQPRQRVAQFNRPLVRPVHNKGFRS